MTKIMINETLKLALEALEEGLDGQTSIEMDEAIHALREALAQQPAQQEPVAWQVMVEDEAMKEFSIKDTAHDWCVQQKLSGSSYTYWIRPLYTRPLAREWVGLTDVEMAKALPRPWPEEGDRVCLSPTELRQFAYGIKENT